MTNFAACRSRRSFFGKHNASTISDTSHSYNRPTESVLLQKSLLLQNARKNGEWSCGTNSIYSGNSSSTHLSKNSINSSNKNIIDNYNSNNNLLNVPKLDNYSQNFSASNCSGRSSVTSITTFNDKKIKKQKCALCKEEINFFREEFVCGHVFHGECIWRFSAINPTYDCQQCPKNCLQRLNRTRSIDSKKSSIASSRDSSTSSRKSYSSNGTLSVQFTF